jgi:hypothetical protein
MTLECVDVEYDAPRRTPVESNYPRSESQPLVPYTRRVCGELFETSCDPSLRGKRRPNLATHSPWVTVRIHQPPNREQFDVAQPIR